LLFGVHGASNQLIVAIDLGCDTGLLLSSLGEQLAAQEPHTASSRPRDCCRLNICHHWSLQPYQFAADALMLLL
jgi:hypothetical protein